MASTAPNPISNPIIFTGQGHTFAFPGNPTREQDRQGSVATDRPSKDGIVTYPWTPDLGQWELEGIVRDLAPLVQFRDLFINQRALYVNLLVPQQARTVLITDVDWEARAEHPYTWRFTIKCKEAEPFQTSV